MRYSGSGGGDTVCVDVCYWGFHSLTLSNTKTIHFNSLFTYLFSTN